MAISSSLYSGEHGYRTANSTPQTYSFPFFSFTGSYSFAFALFRKTSKRHKRQKNEEKRLRLSQKLNGVFSVMRALAVGQPIALSVDVGVLEDAQTE